MRTTRMARFGNIAALVSFRPHLRIGNNLNRSQFEAKEVVMSRVPRLRWVSRLAGLADVLLAVGAAAPALADREVRPA